jgi:hypothetical protein
MPVSISGTNGVTFPDSSLQTAAASPYVLKNRIINGAMTIDQRNNGASITPTATGTYSLDRWRCGLSVSSKYSVQQSTTVPTYFKNSLLVTSTSAYTVGAAETFNLSQLIEGLNVADLGWGTANAQTVTLSFWVRSSLTGTFAGSLRNDNADRSYVFNYTISAANTWEQKTVTIAGDTTGTWLTTNGIGIYVLFSLGSGSTFATAANSWTAGNYLTSTGAVSVVGTSGATWYITGVQLEVGSTATPFERRLYNQELANCQRYFVGIKNNGVDNLLVAPTGVATSATDVGCMLPLLVEMRTQPSISGTSLAVADSVNPVSNVTSISLRTDISTTKGIYFGASGASGLTTYRPYYVRFQNASSGSFNISAEL